MHVADYENVISNKLLLDFSTNTSKLRGNTAASAVSKSGVIENCHIENPVLVQLSLNSCIFKSEAGLRNYKKHI